VSTISHPASTNLASGIWAPSPAPFSTLTLNPDLIILIAASGVKATLFSPGKTFSKKKKINSKLN
jgi:hypothetical protein